MVPANPNIANSRGSLNDTIHASFDGLTVSTWMARNGPVSRSKVRLDQLAEGLPVPALRAVDQLRDHDRIPASLLP